MSWARAAEGSIAETFKLAIVKVNCSRCLAALLRKVCVISARSIGTFTYKLALVSNVFARLREILHHILPPRERDASRGHLRCSIGGPVPSFP
jgi:hypothetical protein